jgi:hypothetical protein
LVSGKNISSSLAPSQPSAFSAKFDWQGLGTPQRGRKMSAQGSALGIDMPRQMALCKSKSTKTQSFAPLGRNLHLRHKPRALPWADISTALQAEFTGQQYKVT